MEDSDLVPDWDITTDRLTRDDWALLRDMLASLAFKDVGEVLAFVKTCDVQREEILSDLRKTYSEGELKP